MKHMSSLYRRLYMLLLLSAFSLVSMAQTLEITKSFKMNEFSTVLTTYKNEFGDRVKQGVKDNAFPYAVIEVHLTGDARAVTAAKEKLSLDMGALYMVEGVTKAYDNKIVFLVSSSVRTIYMTCGDGCAKQAIFEGMQLKPDRIYSGEVIYTPEENPVATTTQAPKRQFFKLQVSPMDAFVEVSENGTKTPWRVVEGVAAKVLNYGIYSYTVSANRYHTEEGTFTVSDGQNSKIITLKPKFGWLSVTGTTETKGAYAFATHKQTGTRVSLGALPFGDKELDAGEYQVLIQQDKYKDYTTSVIVEEGKTSSLKVSLIPNFVQVTLTTQQGADILIDGTKLGTSRYSGTLELGDYSIETRQTSHKSAYTQVSLSAASAGKTIALNNPVPICGSLMIDGLPMLATVYVDNQNKGTAPLIVDGLLIGSYKVRIEKDGYDKYEKTIQVTEGQEEVLKYELVKEVSKTSTASARKFGFSVSATKKVVFSQGNLQYHPAKDEWRFAENPWDYIGDANSKISSTYNGWIDLFGWSTSTTNFGVSTSTSSSDYSGSFVDWRTNKIGNDAPNTWRTLSKEEWMYLQISRPNASSLCGVAQVNGVNGLIFLPDNWTCPAGVTFKSGFHSSDGVDYYAAYQTFTAEQWSKLEAAGAVFLPAAGYRRGSGVYSVQNYGFYWSATEYDSDDAYCLYFDSDGAGMGGCDRNDGQSVRLVKDLK